jgi:hypothetical protein
MEQRLIAGGQAFLGGFGGKKMAPNDLKRGFGGNFKKVKKSQIPGSKPTCLG